MIGSELEENEIKGGMFTCKLVGGNNDDSILGGPDDETIIGQDGDDFIKGGGGNHQILRGPGDDALHDDSGDANGTEYDDALYSNDEDNIITWIGGNDRIEPAGGYNFVQGGTSSDIYQLDNAFGR